METRNVFQKQIILNNLSLIYLSNKKAWMTADIFTDWLISLNERFKQEKIARFIFLIMHQFITMFWKFQMAGGILRFLAFCAFQNFALFIYYKKTQKAQMKEIVTNKKNKGLERELYRYR
jgi:hypothetical protein